MPDTLMLAFQRPSDEVLNAVRACRTTGFDRGDEWSWQAISDGLIDEQTLSLTRLGRLVLAACAPDAPDPVGKVESLKDKVIAEARIVAFQERVSGCPWEMLDIALSELDRATGKAGEVES